MEIRKNRIIGKGGNSQKRVCIVTGTHGDELEGQYVCAKTARILNENLDKLDGIVDIYPAINPLGIDSITRGIPLFDLDMNRIFPGSADGTCAGLLLLAKQIQNDERTHLASMDITAVRNAYGRQFGSFYAEAEFKGLRVVPMTFIRAPYIADVGGNTEVLATVDGKIVAAKQNNMLVTAFHPELNGDTSVHRSFLEMIKQ